MTPKTKARKRKAPPVRTDYAGTPALDPIVETAAQLTFAPPTSACSALDARLMAESAFDQLAELREAAESVPGLVEDIEEAERNHQAIDCQFDNYQEMLRDFLNDKYPGAWEAWITHRADKRQCLDDVGELGVDLTRRRP